MLKAGIITGIFGLFLGVGVALVSPLCVPCVALFLGLIAGFLSGLFDKPREGTETIKTGALAGLITGIILALGQFSGAAINSIVVGPEGAAQFMGNWGMYPNVDATVYWIGMLGTTLCFGFLDILLVAGFGVLGGLGWGVFLRKDDPSQAIMIDIDT